jgi:hypothetical protein
MTQIAKRGVESRQLASATTYYIDPVNGVDSPNTTGGLCTPFKTIHYAGGFAGPGDTVNLHGTGHYNNLLFSAATVPSTKSAPGRPATWSQSSPTPATKNLHPTRKRRLLPHDRRLPAHLGRCQ